MHLLEIGALQTAESDNGVSMAHGILEQQPAAGLILCALLLLHPGLELAVKGEHCADAHLTCRAHGAQEKELIAPMHMHDVGIELLQLLSG